MKQKSCRSQRNKNVARIFHQGESVEERLTPVPPVGTGRKLLTIGFILAVMLSLVVGILIPSVRTFIYLSCSLGVFAIVAAIVSLASNKLKWNSLQNSTRKLVLLCFSLLFALGLVEGALRFFFAKKFSKPPDELSLLYEYHERLGWAPPKSDTK